MHMWKYSTQRFRVSIWAACLFLLSTLAGPMPNGRGQAVSNSQQRGPTQTPYARVNEQAEFSRSGDVNATVELTHALFRATEIPPDFADAFGFTDRIANAEIDYHRGRHPRVSEGDVANAVNHLAELAGAPSWMKTTPSEVRKLRMHMLVLYPNLLSSREPADQNGHRKAVRDDLRPMEAAYVATTMIYQKLINPEYQFTDPERKQNQSLDPDTLRAKQNERLMLARQTAAALPNNHSMRDLLAAGDRFFNDIGIPSTANQTSSRVSTPSTYRGKGRLQ